ncbi:unnamed protein product [Cylindrotheca closterium]|uniref:Uncharacterized protein n=1 Tax=Cylindrotheca closterium TaxID=2856 RepID=A0AAD2G251_9STRA|nr:unnamed protein product [Cylindrotheca closterium]
MNTQTNRVTNQTNNKDADTISFCNLALLGVPPSKHIAKKETSENANGFNRPKRMKLWHQPSARPTVRKVRLKGRKRTKTFAKRAKLRFSGDVKVFEIPSRHDYSPQDRSLIWGGKKEISRNARRNHSEFDAEGEDWRTVVEDDDMFVDAKTGELIHPCWVGDDYSSDVENDSSDDE